MPIFTWENRYSIDVEQIDEHHRHLVALLNKAYDNFLQFSPHGELNKLLHELIDYATYHFSAEEQRMQENNYPQAATHKREHAEFIRRVGEMHADFQSRKVYFLEILGFLYEWLTSHILQTDAELGRFLNAAATRR